MEQILHTNLSQKQELNHSFTQSQIQGVNMLLATNTELLQKIKTELETNPCLESLSSGLEIPSGDLSQTAPSNDEYNQDRAAELAEKDENYAEQASYDTYSDEAFDSSLYPSASSAASPQEARDYFFNSLTAPRHPLEELDELIIEQTDGNEDLKALADAILNNLDPQRGWLQASDDDLAAATGLSPSVVHDFVQRLQKTLEPPGMAAHDLRECLLLQLERRFERGELSWKIVDGHLDDLLNNRIPVIAQDLGCSIADINEALQTIRDLTPWPGLVYSEETAAAIAPEATVLRIHDEWHVVMNHDVLPTLTVSPFYQELVQSQNKNLQKDDVDFIKKHLNRAQTIVSSLSMRQTTLQQITECIVARQKDFLEGGKQFLHPMKLSDIAGDIGRNESTVSRAITNKYLMTPQGLIPYSDFFTHGFSSSNGEDDVSSEAIKQMIQDIIRNEPQEHPLSDQKIADILESKGNPVARRTVAKYREAIGIAPASQRKVFK